MRKLLVFFLTVYLLLPVSAIGEIQIITHTVKQPFGGSPSPDDARIAAVAKAKREAVEKAGTYIESLTVVKNYQVDKDEILALAAGVLKADVVSQKNYASDNAFGIDVVVNVIVDTSVLEERVKKLLQDRTHLIQLNQARLREKVLLEKIAVLERENRKSGKSKQKSANLKKELQAASRGLTAVEWFYRALALADGEKYTDPKKAIEYLSNAIKLQPDLDAAYRNRGVAYSNLGQHQLAIADYTEAIRLKPDDADAYSRRGSAYTGIGQPEQAIRDYKYAIRMEPDGAIFYNNRGNAYLLSNQKNRAILDYDAAIRLNPNLAFAYGNRGFANFLMGQSALAISDCDEAIRLKPDYADAYRTRGHAYIRSGNSREGCSSLIKACDLGDCLGYDAVRKEGDCP